MSEERVCRKCGIAKELTSGNFYRNKNLKGGYYTECKECYTTKQLQYKKDHPEMRKNQCKKHYYKYKEKMNIYSRERYQKDKERIKTVHQKYRETHKQERSESAKAYKLKRPEIGVGISQRRRANLRKLPATLTTEQWEQIKQKFDYKCCYCGKKEELTQEHFISVTNGGEYTHNNIIPSCQSCNSSKGSKNFFEWYPIQKQYSKSRENKILKFLNCDKCGTQQLTMFV